MSNGKTKTQAGRLFAGNFDATGITLLPIGLFRLIGTGVMPVASIPITFC
ncbi:hypothetical protein FORC20_3974 [Salmonella enterica subsp. enterica serovar Typhimurium]|nr:hypothetical protein FORC20_3974 [Salmonella enterica subsp. enterica serovar Typhimurium]